MRPHDFKTQRESVLVEGRTFLIERPVETEGLLDRPPARAAFEADGYIPYWVDLWPGARMLAKWVVRQSWPAGLHALEVGCGLGLPGVAALAMGLRVTFSDYDADALDFAARNARHNGFADFDTRLLDWRQPPDGVRYPVLLAADLLYETRAVEPLVALVRQLLAPDGVCLLSDLERIPSRLLRDALAANGLAFSTQMLRAGEPGGRRLKGTLYRITPAPSAPAADPGR